MRPPNGPEQALTETSGTSTSHSIAHARSAFAFGLKGNASRFRVTETKRCRSPPDEPVSAAKAGAGPQTNARPASATMNRRAHQYPITLRNILNSSHKPRLWLGSCTDDRVATGG